MFDPLSETVKLGIKPYNSPMVLGVHKAKHLRILRDIED